MSTEVVMPQMGESIAEGTITRWMKKQGERVERDEPLFEISTDKVDAEIPSPVTGVLAEILAPEGKTVAVNSVVARVQPEGEAAAKPQEAKPEPQAEAARPAPEPAEQPKPAVAQAPQESAPAPQPAKPATLPEPE